MAFDVYYQENQDALSRSAQKALIKELSEDGDILFLSSGGSALTLLDQRVTQPSVKRLTIGVVDERWSIDPRHNNFLQLTKTQFVQDALQLDAQLLSSVPGDDEELQPFTRRLDRQLHDWRASHPSGTIVVTLGIGTDGHTAGIMPQQNDVSEFTHRFDGNDWVVGYEADDRHPFRATTTLLFLREQVDHAIVFAVSQQKQQALERLTAGNGDLPTTPARILLEMKSVELYTDQKIGGVHE